MKSQVLRLLASLLTDVGEECGADLSRDLLELENRVQHEGLSFLTITLPTYASAFECALASGRMRSEAFPAFKKRRKGSPLPAFLQGLVSQVFDADGCLLEQPSVPCISGIRQICLICKKIELPCSQERVNKAFDAFIDNDKKVVSINDLDPSLVSQLRKVRDYVIPRVFTDVDADCYYGRLIPRHGPGATAERILGNSKYIFKSWHLRLEDHFPAVEFAVPNSGFYDRLGGVNFLAEHEEPPVRVVQVPKTLKTPRTIAIEPVCMQYAQQALAAKVVHGLESAWPTKGHVNFTRQAINGDLALQGSKDGFYATLDLKDASDLVSADLVGFLFENLPNLRNAIWSCRSTRADVNGKTLALRKFASMGSAMCFPCESLAFYCLGLLGCILADGRLPHHRTILKSVDEIYVYGDDIIVPAHKAPIVIRTLQAFGLKVNTNKSFWTGKFRESCGVDAYDGKRVTPVYLRTAPPVSRTDTRQILSWVSTANQLADKQYWRAARYMQRVVEGFLGPLPTVSRDSAGVGWYFDTGHQFDIRMDPHTHVPTVRTYVATPIKRNDPLSDAGALLKWFLHAMQGSSRFLDKEHLSRSVQFRRPVTLRRRWTPV